MNLEPDEDLRNEEWVESAMVNFEQALEEQNRDLAEKVMADTKDNGFEIAAGIMAEKLANYDLTV